METGIIYTVVTALSTVGFYDFVKWLHMRKAVKKKHEVETTGALTDIYERMLGKTETRLDTVQGKLDSTSGENYTLKKKVLELTETIGRLNAELEVLRLQKCEERKCNKRVPPSDY